MLSGQIVDKDLLLIFLKAAEIWGHHFTKRSGILATSVSAQSMAIAAKSKSRHSKTQASMDRLVVHHAKLIDDCCICFMDICRLVSTMSIQLRCPVSHLSQLEKIRARLYLVIVRSAATFITDAETSAQSINVISTALSRCCDVVTDAGSPPSSCDLHVQASGNLLLRSIVESVVAELRLRIVSRGNIKDNAAAALATLRPCVRAALGKLGAASESALTEELLRSLVEAAQLDTI